MTLTTKVITTFSLINSKIPLIVKKSNIIKDVLVLNANYLERILQQQQRQNMGNQRQPKQMDQEASEYWKNYWKDKYKPRNAGQRTRNGNTQDFSSMPMPMPISMAPPIGYGIPAPPHFYNQMAVRYMPPMAHPYQYNPYAGPYPFYPPQVQLPQHYPVGLGMGMAPMPGMAKTTSKSGQALNINYGTFPQPWEEPPYEPFKYYGGHEDDEDAPLEIDYENREIDLTKCLAPLLKGEDANKSFKYPIKLDEDEVES
ncbi:UNKNOWN [Stylonychia lemnae]|uniref:Uncharacterized protein n=1 Tax=Stylonychia lemnae TaxID=5949 RepID=A0A078AVE9_STYLE|nr:UNKNOWN [Stylonychia lemnae]|eukprot:CDW86159.1 UNKNOWN [Stylonychia lemnae]